MTTDDTARSDAPLAPRLLTLGREAYARGQYETAYHALTAAMHAASDERAADTLAAVEAEAKAQIAWIDRHTPAHRLATAAAARRGHPGVYAMLIRQSAAHLTMLAHPAPDAVGTPAGAGPASAHAGDAER